jgi:ribosomal protein S6--L-glutamate ligase
MAVMHDLYILKSHAELWLSLAGVLHNLGAHLLNPYPACMAAYNKIVASQTLRAASIPCPVSWVTGNLHLLRSIVAERPLIIKPCFGGRGRDVHVVRNPHELAGVPPIERPWLIQEYVPGPGVDLKLYVIGDQVFGLRKPVTSDSYKVPGQPCDVDDHVREIAVRCGQVFGLGLYGLDVIESPDGPVVVDVNYFPSYKGVPDAARLMADYVEGYARRRYSLPALGGASAAAAPAIGLEPSRDRVAVDGRARLVVA